MADAPPAASSAAETSTLSPTDALAQASPEAYAAWQQTGELPASSDPPVAAADSTPAEPVVQAPDAVPASSAEVSTGKRTDARAEENRVPVLLADRAKERTRAEAAEARAAQLERDLAALRQPAPSPDARPAVSSPAPATDPRPDKNDAAKYPEGQYGDDYVEDLSAWKTRQLIREAREEARVEAQEHQKKQQDEARVHSMTDAWFKRMAAAKSAHPDFDEAQAGRLIPPGSPVDDWIRNAGDSGAEVAHYLVTHPAEVARLLGLPDRPAFSRAMVSLEASLAPAVPKTISDAPAPGRTLGSRAVSPGDAVTAALAAKDVGAYIDAANRREVAARH